jgi:cellulose synthase (UDP-forming)
VVWSEQSLFFRVIMLGKDYWNAAFFCGSCAMARRSAIEAIGGFATETITEDLHTSIRLHKKGFGSVYHAESLAYGIAPDTFEPYESQRVRWGQGAMQVWRLERIATARNLTLAQRICYLASILTYFDGWQKGFMFLLPSFVLITGIVPVASLDWSFAARFLPWFVLSMLVTEELGRGYARSWTIEQYNFLRSPGFAFATLTLFLNRKLRFRVTKKSGGLAIENVRRLAPHFAVIAVALLSPIAGAARYMLSPYMTVSALALNVLWCILTLVVAISAVRFAFRHSKQERGSYRFRLPIPVRIRDRRGHTHIFPVEDISSGGFSAFIPENLAVEAGAAPDADLILPSGVLHVGLNVLRVWTLSGSEGQPRRVLAVQFAWRTRNDEDCLDLYLYGSNAEWRFSGLTEQENTPVAWLTARLKSLRRGSAKVRQDWRTALVVPTDCTRSIEVLTSTEKGAPAVSTFLAEVPIRIGDALTLISPQGGNHIGYYRVESLRRFDGRGRMMFQHRLSKLDALPQTGSSHAVSRWWGQAELTAA